jgi:3-oxoacyl-[acyl-carrier protein] reductase
MLLEDKNAVIYGAGGSIGGAVAQAFAREGTKVFLAGRTKAKLDEVAEEIRSGRRSSGNGAAQRPRRAGRRRTRRRRGREGRRHRRLLQRRLDPRRPARKPAHPDTMRGLDSSDLTGVKTYFHSATATARHMVRKRSGVVLALSSSAVGLSGRDRRYHLTGGFGTASAAIEALPRSLAGELGPQGIRLVCSRSDALPESWPAEATEVRTDVPGKRDRTWTSPSTGRGCQCSGLHGLRSGQRDDGDRRQPDLRLDRRLGPEVGPPRQATT